MMGKTVVRQSLFMWLILSVLGAVNLIDAPATLFDPLVHGLQSLSASLGIKSAIHSTGSYLLFGLVLLLSMLIIVVILQLLSLPFVIWSNKRLGYVPFYAFVPLAIFLLIDSLFFAEKSKLISILLTVLVISYPYWIGSKGQRPHLKKVISGTAVVALLSIGMQFATEKHSNDQRAEFLKKDIISLYKEYDNTDISPVLSMLNEGKGNQFIKLSASGEVLPESATEWACVWDKNSQRIWEVKTTDDSVQNAYQRYPFGGKTESRLAIGQSQLDFQFHKLTSKGFSERHDDMTEKPAENNWNQLIDSVNKKKLCGFSNWRVPNVFEAVSLHNAFSDGLDSLRTDKTWDRPNSKGDFQTHLNPSFFPHAHSAMWVNTVDSRLTDLALKLSLTKEKNERDTFTTERIDRENLVRLVTDEKMPDSAYQQAEKNKQAIDSEKAEQAAQEEQQLAATSANKLKNTGVVNKASSDTTETKPQATVQNKKDSAVSIDNAAFQQAAHKVNTNAKSSPIIINTKIKRDYITQAGLVIDRDNNVMWMRCSAGQTWDGKSCVGESIIIPKKQAIAMAGNLSYGGYDDWRLPTIKELESMLYCSNGVDGRRFDLNLGCKGKKAYLVPAYPQDIFPAKTYPETHTYWSSSIKEESGDIWTLLLSFDSGTRGLMIRDWQKARVRFIRSFEP